MRAKGPDIPQLSEEVRRQLAQGLQPIRKDEVTIHTRNDKGKIVTIRSPASVRFSSKGRQLLTQCAGIRKLESPYPQALRAHKSNLPGYIVLEPVQAFDRNQPDLYLLSWQQGNRICQAELRPILQPRNLEVPPGYVGEMPVTLEELPDNGWFLVLHTTELKTRKLTRKDQADSDTASAAATDEAK